MQNIIFFEQHKIINSCVYTKSELKLNPLEQELIGLLLFHSCFNGSDFLPIAFNLRGLSKIFKVTPSEIKKTAINLKDKCHYSDNGNTLKWIDSNNFFFNANKIILKLDTSLAPYIVSSKNN